MRCECGKVAIVGDLHFGIAPNNLLKSEVLFESQKSFIVNVLVPHLESRSIDTIIFLGDVYDQRKKVDLKIAQYVEDLFQNTLKSYKNIIIQGNHDTYYKDDLSVTSLSNVWSKQNVTVVNTISKTQISGIDVLLVPWMTSEVQSDFINNVHTMSNKFKYVFGHFEVAGFPFDAGNTCINGISPNILYENFENVISGHFHTQSYKKFNENSIHYVGTPFQLSFADENESKGFFILDVVTNHREFIENKESVEFVRFDKMSDLSKYTSLSKCIVEYRYDDSITDSDLHDFESMVMKKNPVSYRSYLKRNVDIDNSMTIGVVGNIKTADDMNLAIRSGDIISMASVFLKNNPHEDVDLLFDMLRDFARDVR